jgi:hypothetical protein
LCGLIPPGLKLKHFTEKYILRQALKEVVPAEIRRHRKRAPTVPYEWWLRQPLPDFAQALLSEACLRAKGSFDPGAVVALFARQRAGHGKFGRLLMVVLGVRCGMSCSSTVPPRTSRRDLGPTVSGEDDPLAKSPRPSPMASAILAIRRVRGPSPAARQGDASTAGPTARERPPRHTPQPGAALARRPWDFP